MNEVKVVDKPWGKEVWVGLTKDYCFKRIEIKPGYLTSLQFHHEKEEHIYIHSGKGILTYEDPENRHDPNNPDSPPLLTKEVGPGDVIHNPPGWIHRLEAVEYLTFYEASTPEVDDVVRLEDGYGREDK